MKKSRKERRAERRAEKRAMGKTPHKLYRDLGFYVTLVLLCGLLAGLNSFYFKTKESKPVKAGDSQSKIGNRIVDNLPKQKTESLETLFLSK